MEKLRDILNRIIRSLGRTGYSIDNGISSRVLIIILKEKFAQIIRGFCARIFIKKVQGILFIGRSCRIKHGHLIQLGKSVFIGDNVTINALSRKGVVIGNNFSIHSYSTIDCTGAIRALGEGLVIGNNVGISPNCYIQVRGSVRIGNNVIFGPGAKIFSESHNHFDTDKFINEQGETRKGVTIEDGVWIGSDAIVLDGVRVGEHSIIAAKSLVTKNVPPYSIVSGIPASVLLYRKSKEN